jgi:hypothetical protein
LLAALLALVAAPVAHAQQCTGELDADAVTPKAGPRVVFGINPAGEAGALGPRVEPVPDQPAKTLAALRRLRPANEPFAIRLNRFFWSQGDAAIRKFDALVDRYRDAGYLVELQLRYHPKAEQEGDIAAWTAFVRDVVRRFGSRVIAIQVTNEVNLTVSPDSSDGAYEGARDALIQGVIAAKDEALGRGYDGLGIGFNWFYRTDPGSEQDLWEYLRDQGGARFVRAVDWIGLDVYPGTFFPPTSTDGGEDAIVNALSTLRCYAAIPGIPSSVPIHVEENGWPTQPPARSYARQAEVAETMIRTVHRFRGNFNVSDYRWFDLRDHRTSSTNLQHHYGLMEDDYSEKPVFSVYRRLVGELSARSAAVAPRRAIRLKLTYWRGRGGCARGNVRAGVVGRALRASFFAGRRRFGRDTRPPLRRVLSKRRIRPGRSYRIRARVRLRDGRVATLSRPFRGC